MKNVFHRKMNTSSGQKKNSKSKKSVNILYYDFMRFFISAVNDTAQE